MENNEVNIGLGNVAEDTYTYINNLLTNPTIIMILLVVIVIYIVIFLSTSFSSNIDTNSEGSSNGTNIFMVLTIGLIIFLILVNGLQYLFSIDVFASVKNLFTNNPEVDIVVDQSNAVPSVVPEIKTRPQVFNIPENDYVYPDAKALCKAYGARLATYQEVEDSYNSGGEWCNYGWSEGQMALFPTQTKTWDKLQTIEGHENDCGRPGVNGGYMANPKLRFGVNCFGYKPRMTEKEEELMATQPEYPITAKDIAMENRVNYWKSKLTEVLVSPFNHNMWSKI